MIYLLSEKDRKKFDSKVRNFKQENVKVFTPENMENTIPEELSRALLIITSSVQDIITKKLLTIKTVKTIQKTITTQTDFILREIFIRAKKDTQENFTRSFNEILFLSLILSETATAEEENNIKCNFKWNEEEVINYLYPYTFTAHKIVLQENFDYSEEKAEGLVKAAIREGAVNKPYIKRKEKPNYVFARGLPSVMNPSRAKNRSIKKAESGKETLKASGQNLTVYVYQSALSKNGHLSHDSKRILLYLLEKLNSEIYRGQRELTEDKPLYIKTSDIISDIYNYNEQGTAKYKNITNKKITKGFKELMGISIEFKLSNGTKKVTHLLEELEIKRGSGEFGILFKKRYVNFLIEPSRKLLIPMWDLIRIQDNIALDIGIKLHTYYYQKNNHIRANGNPNKLKVYNIIKEIDIKQYEELTANGKKKWAARIKQKFEHGLNVLKAEGCLKNWHYEDKEGNTINPGEIKNYATFKNLYIYFIPKHEIFETKVIKEEPKPQ